MADTLVYLQENNVDSREQLAGSLSHVSVKLDDAHGSLHEIEDELKDVNRQIHFTGQYLSNKKTYQQMLRSINKGLYRKRHEPEIKAYEEARKYMKERFPDSQTPSIKILKERKSELLELREQYRNQAKSLDQQKLDLSVIFSNVDAILDGRMSYEPVRKQERAIL